MISALFDSPNYVGMKKMLDATVLRHDAIASNLSHLETPNYKRVDVAPTFAAELKQAMAARNPDRIATLRPQLAVDALAVSPNKDGNTVQLESELLNLNQNMVEHALETQLVSGSLLRMRLAITGKG